MESLKARPPRQRSWFERWWTDWWLGELLTIAFSCGLNIALGVVLQHYDERPLPMFGTLLNTGLTLNTVVSLLATFSVAASIMVVQESLSQLKWLWYVQRSRSLADIEVYDQASRGSLGSLQLLWKLRLRPLPSIGAILVVIHLIIAPLTQQSVLTVLTPVAAENEFANAPRNNLWNTSVSTENYLMPGGYNRINHTIKGSTLSGLFYDEASLPDVAPECTSGNCTFPLYQSLAVCSSVADVSDSLSVEIVQPGKEDDSLARWCLPGDHCLNATGKTPTLAWVRSAAGPDAGKAWEPVPAQHLTMLNFTSVAFADRRAAIADVYLIYRNATHAGYRATDTLRPVEDLRYSALEMVLEWCIPTFHTAVVNGTAATTTLPDVFRDFDVPNNLDPFTGSLDPISASVNGTMYRVDQFTHDSLQRYLWTLLTGNIDAPGRLDTPEAFFNLSFTDSDAAQTIWAATQIDGGDQWDDGIHQVPSGAHAIAALRRIMHNTATSMSNHIRKQSRQPPQRGRATVVQNIVAVDYGYLAVLCVFTGVALAFLLVVMGYGATSNHHTRAPLPVLKSSTLAVLHCRDQTMPLNYMGIRAEGSMAEDADGLHVRLIPGVDGSWTLVPSWRERSTF